MLARLSRGTAAGTCSSEKSVLQDEVAVKMVSRGVSNAKAAEREIANLRLCALHPYIIHMREARLVAYLV